MGDANGAFGEAELPIDPDLEGGPLDRRGVDPLRHRRAERTILLAIATAGVAGALARYGLSRVLLTEPGHFPWSTFWVNVSGAGVIGFVLVLLIERFPRARLARPMIATGFLGAYTTFSTYTVDADDLFRLHDLATGTAYLLLSLGAGALATVLGIALARGLVRLEHGLEEQLG